MPLQSDTLSASTITLRGREGGEIGGEGERGGKRGGERGREREKKREGVYALVALST